MVFFFHQVFVRKKKVSDVNYGFEKSGHMLCPNVPCRLMSAWFTQGNYFFRKPEKMAQLLKKKLKKKI